MDQNTLLTLMIIAYISPIGVVYYKYSTAVSGAGTRSISSIITSQEPLFAHENDTRGGGNVNHYSKRDTSSQRLCSSWPYSRYYTNTNDVSRSTYGGPSSPSSFSSSGYLV